MFLLFKIVVNEKHLQSTNTDFEGIEYQDFIFFIEATRRDVCVMHNILCKTNDSTRDTKNVAIFEQAKRKFRF